MTTAHILLLAMSSIFLASICPLVASHAPDKDASDDWLERKLPTDLIGTITEKMAAADIGALRTSSRNVRNQLRLVQEFKHRTLDSMKSGPNSYILSRQLEIISERSNIDWSCLYVASATPLVSHSQEFKITTQKDKTAISMSFELQHDTNDDSLPYYPLSHLHQHYQTQLLPIGKSINYKTFLGIPAANLDFAITSTGHLLGISGHFGKRDLISISPWNDAGRVKIGQPAFFKITIQLLRKNEMKVELSRKINDRDELLSSRVIYGANTFVEPRVVFGTQVVSGVGKLTSLRSLKDLEIGVGPNSIKSSLVLRNVHLSKVKGSSQSWDQWEWESRMSRCQL